MHEPQIKAMSDVIRVYRDLPYLSITRTRCAHV